MGHLRTGSLPKTRKWQEVVSSVGATSRIDDSIINDIAEKTLDASSQALRKLPYDMSLQRCFQFLTVLAVAGQSADIKTTLNNLGLNIGDVPSKLQLSRALRIWLENMDEKAFNPEFGNLARNATTDTISAWLNEHLSQPQISMFSQSEDPFNPWKKAADGSGFCELSRQFFTNFVARYLDYFLSRTASSQIKTIDERENFAKAIKERVDIITQHAFETSKIVQSFSAGWFNKHAIGKIPSTKEIEGFLQHALEKIREEFRIQKVQD